MMNKIETLKNFFNHDMPLGESLIITRKYVETFTKPEQTLGKRIKCYKLEHVDVIRNEYENGFLDELRVGNDLEFYLKEFQKNKQEKLS